MRPRSEAAVSIDDFGFLYGAACFETMRAFGGVVFRLDRHLARLAAGLDALGVVAPTSSDLVGAIQAALEANTLRDARVRLTVSAGRGPARPDLSSSTAPTVLVVCDAAPANPAPARLVVASQRVDPARPLAMAKNANYLASIVALAEARRAGADDALLLGPSGDIVEAATANLFVVSGASVITPPIDAGPLPGVTREAVVECAHALGMQCVEAMVTPEEVREADEVFLTNSVVGIRPVAAISDLWSGTAVPGPATTALDEAYHALIRRECGFSG